MLSYLSRFMIGLGLRCFQSLRMLRMVFYIDETLMLIICFNRLETVMRVISNGLFGCSLIFGKDTGLNGSISPAAYLQHPFNRADLIAVVAFWLEMVLRRLDVAQQRWLRTLAMFRTLRLLCILPGPATIIDAFQSSGPILLSNAVYISATVLFFRQVL